MIALLPSEHDALRRIAAARDQGVQLGGIAVSTAVRLALAGLAEMTTTTPQRAVITRQGRAFLHRGAH